MQRAIEYQTNLCRANEEAVAQELAAVRRGMAALRERIELADPTSPTARAAAMLELKNRWFISFLRDLTRSLKG